MINVDKSIDTSNKNSHMVYVFVVALKTINMRI